MCSAKSRSASRVEQGRTLVAEAERRGLKLGCAPDTFLGAGGRLAREIIDSGRIGKVLSGTCFLMSHGMEHWHPDPEFYFKPGGGPILDMAPYYLAALINLHRAGRAACRRAPPRDFAERVVTAAGPRKGQAITVETPTTVMALVRFVSGADIMFTMSWDVWKHGHPPIELYGTEGSLRVPDPNFFGGVVEYTERGGDWISVDSSEQAVRTPELALAGLARHDAGSRQLSLPRRRRARRAPCGARRAASIVGRAREPCARRNARDSSQPVNRAAAVAVQSSVERPAAFTDRRCRGP